MLNFNLLSSPHCSVNYFYSPTSVFSPFHFGPFCHSSSESHSVLSGSLQPHGLYSSWNSPGETVGVGSCSLLQGIFPTQGLNLGLLHCRRIYHLSHLGSLRILEWVTYPFSSRSSRPRVSALQVDSLPAELPGKPFSVIGVP